jgi:hypothetical protein
LKQVIDRKARAPAEIVPILNEKPGKLRVDAKDFAERLAEAERDAP